MSKLQSINPANGELVATYEETSDAGLEQTLASAHAAFVQWRKTEFDGRARLMSRAASLMRERTPVLAELVTREMGKPITQSRAEIEKSALALSFYADNAQAMLAPEPVATDATKSFVRFDPLGVIFTIMPWNFPFWQAVRCVAPTVMAGNTVVLKHAESTVGCGEALVQVFEDAGFPAGVFQSVIVHRERAARILRDEHVRGVSLTGSVGAGRTVGKLAGELLKPAVLELGGSDPCIVLADANLDEAVSAAVSARMINSGQSCIAAKRFIIEAPLYDAFVRAFKERLGSYVIGDPMNTATQVGPMARADLRDVLLTQIQDTVKQGARLVLGGRAIPGAGYFLEPTVLADVTPGMRAFDDETFGPIAALCRANDTEHAISLANQSVYGLGASLHTSAQRGEALAASIEAGHVSVNGIVKSDPRLPFGGIKDSGIGRELGRHGLLSFVNIKTVWIR